MHNIGFNFLFLFFLSEADQFFVVNLIFQLLHQELRVETVLFLTVYEVLHDLLLFSLIWSIVRRWSDDDSLSQFALCPGGHRDLAILLIDL